MALDAIVHLVLLDQLDRQGQQDLLVRLEQQEQLVCKESWEILVKRGQ
ncbi:hypothetical protein PALU110988_03765 [Paenibacillus lupini]